MQSCSLCADTRIRRQTLATGSNPPPEQKAAGSNPAGGTCSYEPSLLANARLMSAGVPNNLVPQVIVAAGRAYCPDKLHSLGYQ